MRVWIHLYKPILSENNINCEHIYCILRRKPAITFLKTFKRSKDGIWDKLKYEMLELGPCETGKFPLGPIKTILWF